MTDYKEYLITLKPLDRFFFGGKKQTEVEKKENKKTDYYLKSQYFPQQTAILGMIRHQLLLQNNLIPLKKDDNKKHAANLIGPESFNPEAPNQSFGIIEQISPIFIKDEKCCYYPAPLDSEMEISQNSNNQKKRIYLNQKGGPIKDLTINPQGFTSKNHNPEDKFITTCERFIKTNEIFKHDEQVGIKKGIGGQTQDDAYYKQVFLRFKDPTLTFAFYLKIKTTYGDEKKSVAFNENLITFGGERSAFFMKLDQPEEPKPCIPHSYKTKKTELPRFLLTSDAFVKPEILNHCELAFTKDIFFRNFRSKVKTTQKYWNLANKENPDTPYLANPYNLLGRGSVLFYKNPEDQKKIEDLLKNQNYQKIGFNHYKIYPIINDNQKGENT